MNVCFPHPPGAGGPGSFQLRFESYLTLRGWQISYKGDHSVPDLVFVVGGTRHLCWLIWMKLKRIPIVYRLDGISWLHRRKKIGLRKKLTVELSILAEKAIHAWLADKIVYQSHFAEGWWNKAGWRNRNNSSVIYNGVSIPVKNEDTKEGTFSSHLVVLEGNIDYSPYAVKLLNELASTLPSDISLELYGNFEYSCNKEKLNHSISYLGFLDRKKVYGVLTGSVYLSLDINPACPNTVIEALACGAPVVAFDTGSLLELVPGEAGIIVPYGSDPWQLGYPDVKALADAICKVKNNYSLYSQNARKVAGQRYSIDDMAAKYMDVINKAIHDR